MLNPDNAPNFGSDPEGFFKLKNRIVGSEKLIPETGISAHYGSIVRDGVQFELNPYPSPLLHRFGDNISDLFKQLVKRINEDGRGITVCFDGLVEVDRKELNSLCGASRILGCMPSYNVYGDKPINVDPVTYRKRSAGGHIHFGFDNEALLDDRRRLVPVCDVLVGMLSVLLDRDAGAAERRENYGRAGEFRTPKHGLEYRTTSNYWLRSYTLLNFVFGMAGAAYDLAYQTCNGNQTVWNSLVGSVNIQRVAETIDYNNFPVALANFKRLIPFLKQELPANGYPLTPTNLTKFVDFVTAVERYGIQKFFPTENILNSWIAGERVTFAEYLEKL
jgi:hypothetical protein